MTARDYLSQAYRLEQRVNSKLMQLDALRSLTQRVTAAYDKAHVSQSKGATSLQDTIVRMMEVETELDAQVDALIDLKADVARRISAIANIDHQLLLEKRYLCYQSWEQIATDSNYSLRWIHTLHARALAAMNEALAMEGDGALTETFP